MAHVFPYYIFEIACDIDSLFAPSLSLLCILHLTPITVSQVKEHDNNLIFLYLFGHMIVRCRDIKYTCWIASTDAYILVS